MNRSQPSPVTFDKKDVDIIACETLYRGFFSLNLHRFRHRLFNGEISAEI
ncbi:MAG: ADP-ribose diphosphatase, partial [Serratia symbiotica]|nr:ADP-ribose diphosphatase [Serratia symbiotica]